jgi:hypothetical protein
VKITVEDIGSSVERWVPASTADRDLVITDESGKRIATLHQSKTRSTTTIAAPTVRSFKSTANLDEAKKFPGVMGGATTLELANDPPASVRFLSISIAAETSYVHSSVVATSFKKRILQTATYSRKSCAHGGPGPVFIGQHVELRWVDELGRRSAPGAATISKQKS